jgi:hypothetical protein
MCNSFPVFSPSTSSNFIANQPLFRFVVVDRKCAERYLRMLESGSNDCPVAPFETWEIGMLVDRYQKPDRVWGGYTLRKPFAALDMGGNDGDVLVCYAEPSEGSGGVRTMSTWSVSVRTGRVRMSTESLSYLPWGSGKTFFKIK